MMIRLLFNVYYSNSNRVYIVQHCDSNFVHGFMLFDMTYEGLSKSFGVQKILQIYHSIFRAFLNIVHTRFSNLMLSFARIMEVVTSQNGLLQNCHLSEWTFAELSLVRIDFCRIVIYQNEPLLNCHLSE